MKVAFIGTGKMGLPMAGNVLRAGHDLTVFNRTTSRTDPLRDDGATVATSAAEAVRDAEVLVTMVADGAALDAQLEGDEGFLSEAPDGLVWLEMSTIGPTAARRFAARAADAGIQMLDAPVSGSVTVAEAGGLVAMVGGPAEALERARPVLEAMTKAHFHLGGAGAGAAMKLGVNVMIASQTVAISEALNLAEAAGIERADAYEVIAAGALASPFVDYKKAAFLDPDGTPPAFALDLMRKDLKLALEQGEAAGLPLLGAGAAAEAVTVAAGLEGGDQDLVRVADALRRIATGTSGDAKNSN
ncbi:MAG TPA: NAD(P)-dependent oxidoreductase [Solirubrobacterales bacterium]|nr:NAD(P)-dependent oxidoreductase [Solirubrobacterales bacterium]